MPSSQQERYQVVIIGAGIGGLVCGAYLARAGVRVFLAERHSQPGGYCTSFRRRGFVFDAAAHSFGGYREGGLVSKVCRALGIDALLKTTRHSPADVIITPHGRISFQASPEETEQDISSAFPAESDNVKAFFRFLINPPAAYFARARNQTFKHLLDQFFSDERLKSILAFPLYGNGGLPPHSLSALIGTKMFVEFLLDGGYYPEGGMQQLPNSLAKRFTDHGGTLRLSCEVKRINLEDHSVAGITLADGTVISASCVVSNADAMHTFSVLVGRENLPDAFRAKIAAMVPSRSMFVLYLGVDSAAEDLPLPGTNYWHLPHYDLQRLYDETASGHSRSIIMIRRMPDRKGLLAFAPACFMDKTYWKNNKQCLIDYYIDSIDRLIIPGLSQKILYKDAATPHTLFRYTLNYHGAAYGWEATPNQIGDADFRKPAFLQGLYLTGHWSTAGLGIPGVIYSGYDTAQRLARKFKVLID